MLARDDIGSIEGGKCADLAVWRTDGLELGGAEDPVAGLVLSGPHRVDRLLVGGEDVVRDGRLVGPKRTRSPASIVCRQAALPLGHAQCLALSCANSVTIHPHEQ